MRSIAKGKVLLYGPRPRLAYLPMEEIDRLPEGSRYTADNTGVKKLTSIICAAVLGVWGCLFSLGLFIVFMRALGFWVIFSMIMVPTIGALTGAFVGWRFLAPLFFTEPLWIIRFNGWVNVPHGEERVPDLEAVRPDHWLDKEWPKYFENLQDAISQEVGEEKAKTMVDPQRSKMITARWDASSMAYLQAQENEAMDLRGGLGPTARMAMAITGGAIFFAFIGFMVFTIVVADL